MSAPDLVLGQQVFITRAAVNNGGTTLCPGVVTAVGDAVGDYREANVKIFPNTGVTLIDFITDAKIYTYAEDAEEEPSGTAGYVG